MNNRSIVIALLVIIAIALGASTVHYSRKAEAAARAEQELRLGADDYSARSAKAEEERKALALDRDRHMESARTERERFGKEASGMKSQHALTTDELRMVREQSDALRAQVEILKTENTEVNRLVESLRAEIRAFEALRAADKSSPVLNAVKESSNGPSAWWRGKEWYSNDELRRVMWLYRFPAARTDEEQPIEYREAQAELRRRGSL